MQYKDIKNLKQKEITLLENKLKEGLILYPTELNSYFEDFLFNGAKRLRPLFLFLICDLMNECIDENVLNLAVGVELIHSASLIHDDILDDGKIRRGMPCLHETNGQKIAVLAGDYLLSLAIDFLTKINNIEVVKIMTDACYKMTKSEIRGFNQRFIKLNEAEYLENIKNKTSSLFIAQLKSLEQIKKIKIKDDVFKFAQNFSIIFQLKDDINNFLRQDRNKISNDIESGVYTLPVILYEHGIMDNGKNYLNNFIDDTIKLIKNSPLIQLLELMRI